MRRLDENHSFNIHIAAVVGIEEALILKEFYGWCHMKLSSKKGLILGVPFVYYSAAALADKFCYLKERSISRKLDALCRDGWMYSLVNNNKKYDRTRSYTVNFEKYDNAVQGLNYTISQNGEWISQFGEWISQNGEWISQNGEPIPSPTTTPTTTPTPKREISLNENPKEEKSFRFSVIEIFEKKILGSGWFEKMGYKEQQNQLRHLDEIVIMLSDRFDISKPNTQPEKFYEVVEMFLDSMSGPKFKYERKNYKSLDKFRWNFTTIIEKIKANNDATARENDNSHLKGITNLGDGLEGIDFGLPTSSGN